MISTARKTISGLCIAGSALFLAPVVSAGAQQQVQTSAHVKHHSVLKGAAVGAVAGHFTHHKHGTLVGAAIGAGVQHHRNRKTH